MQDPKPSKHGPFLDPSVFGQSARRGAHQSFPLACGLRFFLNTGAMEATTSSVSCEGFTFVSGISFGLREQHHCEITVRPYESGGSPMTLSCRARVTRVDRHAQGGFEIACEFEEYFVVPQKPLSNR